MQPEERDSAVGAGSDNWRGLMSQLHSCFERSEQRLLLLSELDRAILNSETSIQDIETLTLAGLAKDFSLDGAYILVREGRELTSVSHFPTDLPRLSLPHSGSDGMVTLPVTRLESGHAFSLVPIRLHGALEGSLLLMAGDDATCHAAANDDFLTRVLSQLEIAHLDRLDKKRHQLFAEFHNAFNDRDLDLSSCYKFVRQRIFDILDNTGDGLVVQILTRENDLLYIRSTSGSELENTRVSINDSLTGMCLTKQLPYYKCDPKDHPSYKAIGVPSGAMRSELVVPLRRGADFYGVINAESPHQEAFSHHHVDFMTAVAEAVGPQLHPLIVRAAMAVRERRLMLYGVRTMFERLSVLYAHQLTSPIHNCRAVATLLRQNAGRLEADDVQALFENLYAGLNRMELASQDLFQHFEQIATPGSYDINTLVDEALRAFANVSNITIQFDHTLVPLVFCSRILREHVVNVIQNALDSVTWRLGLDSRRPGLIRISIAPLEASAASSLNRYVSLKVWDNGIGVAPHLRPQLFTVLASSKGTQGVALAAARGYLQTIGGRIACASDDTPGESYAEFTIVLQVYQESLHRNADGFERSAS